jgi:hypothetical protein
MTLVSAIPDWHDMKFSVLYRYHSEVSKMISGDVFAGSVPVVSCGDSAIIWPYTIQSLEERAIESLLKKYLYSWTQDIFSPVPVTASILSGRCFNLSRDRARLSSPEQRLWSKWGLLLGSWTRLHCSLYSISVSAKPAS